MRISDWSSDVCSSDLYVVTLRSAHYNSATRGIDGIMFAETARGGALDRLAIGLSGLCLVHCLASAVLVAVLASAAGLLVSPVIHEVGLVLARSEEHTSELQSLMRISYAVFCLTKQTAYQLTPT